MTSWCFYFGGAKEILWTRNDLRQRQDTFVIVLLRNKLTASRPTYRKLTAKTVIIDEVASVCDAISAEQQLITQV